MSREQGITGEQLGDLHRYRDSPAFSELERLVLDLATAMNRLPADIPAELTRELRCHLDEAQMVELAAAIAWEGYRSRFNRVFGIAPVGYSEGAACAVPERPTAP